MKKQFAKLTKSEQEKAEAEYHCMKSEEFDNVMSQAEPHSPNAIRLSPRLVKRLKSVAESEGEPEYQAMYKDGSKSAFNRHPSVRLRHYRIVHDK